MVLTDSRVRSAKATGKTYTLGDYDGLSLFVSSKGSKAWHFRYAWLGRQSRMSLGMYPELSLRDARAMRNEARALIAKGINPRIARKQKRHAARLAGEHTFIATYERCRCCQRRAIAADHRHRAIWLRTPDRLDAAHHGQWLREQRWRLPKSRSAPSHDGSFLGVPSLAGIV